MHFVEIDSSYPGTAVNLNLTIFVVDAAGNLVHNRREQPFTAEPFGFNDAGRKNLAPL